MPRYHFDIRNHASVAADEEGTEFHDFAAARREATESARDLLIACLKRGMSPKGIAIEITDDAGNLLESLVLTEFNLAGLDSHDENGAHRLRLA